MRIGVLISGRGSNLNALIKAQMESKLSAKIVVVISNIAEAKGLEIATNHGIRVKVIDHNLFNEREKFDNAVHKVLLSEKVDLVCLAGFMRIIGDNLVNKWTDRIVNIHPSLLPAFKGLNTHERVLESGVKFTGCTTHFVRPAVDEGPIIMQSVVPVLPGDNPESLGKRVLAQEHKIYPTTLNLIAEGNVRIIGRTVQIKGANVSSINPIINPIICN